MSRSLVRNANIARSSTILGRLRHAGLGFRYAQQGFGGIGAFGALPVAFSASITLGRTFERYDELPGRGTLPTSCPAPELGGQFASARAGSCPGRGHIFSVATTKFEKARWKPCCLRQLRKYISPSSVLSVSLKFRPFGVCFFVRPPCLTSPSPFARIRQHRPTP